VHLISAYNELSSYIHRPCIANTIAYCEEAEVKCPYRDPDYTCESTLQEREIKAVSFRLRLPDPSFNKVWNDPIIVYI